MRIYLASDSANVSEILEEYPHLEQYLGWLNSPRSAMSFDTLKKSGLPIGVDNSAFTNFDEARYVRLIQRINCRVEWVTLPDVVGDAQKTTELFFEWQHRILFMEKRIHWSDMFMAAYVGQDGCEDIEIPWDSFGCFFIGGTTEWKLSQTTADIVREAKRRGKCVHMGRVNSQKRLRYAHWLGCDSVDGSGYSRWARKCLVRDLHYLHDLHTNPQGELF